MCFRPHCCLMAGLVLAGSCMAAGCTSHRVKMDPVEVRPIHMTLDINIRIDRELDRFFEFEDEVPVDNRLPADDKRGPEVKPSDSEGPGR